MATVAERSSEGGGRFDKFDRFCGRRLEPVPVSGKPCIRGRAAWIVYMLRCRDGSLYTGITNDLAKRLKVHAAGRASRYTRSRLPVAVVYQERQPTKSRALSREAAVKKLSKREKESLVAEARGGAPRRSRSRR